MIRITKDKKIQISRGDTRIIPCRFRHPSMYPSEGAMAIVTLKRDYNDKKSIWVKKYYILNGRFNIRLTHDDTNLLNDMKYYYDIQIRYPDGEQYTLIPPTEFKILGVCGNAEG